MDLINASIIVQHLKEYLPRVTDDFSDVNSVSAEILAGVAPPR